MIRLNGAMRVARDDEAGISIVELMVAMVILGITMMGIALTVMNSLSLSRSNANRVVAANIAASEIEAHLSLEFDELLARLGPADLDDVEVDGRTFEVTRDIYWSTNEADIGPCISGDADAADENVIRIDISVTWTRTLGVHPVVSSTTVSPPVDTFGSVGGTIAVYVVDHDNQPVEGVSARLFGPIETSPVTQPVSLTDEHGCAVFEGLNIGTYRAAIARPEGFGASTATPFVDIDQRLTPYPLANTLTELDLAPNPVTSLTGVSSRSRVTTEFFYTPSNEVTVTAEGWAGGVLPTADFEWQFENTRDRYSGGVLGTTVPMYPGEYEIWAGHCEVSDPLDPMWEGASRSAVTASPPGGETAGVVTFGSFDVVWDASVTPDASREIALRAEPLDDACDEMPDIDLGITTVGAADVRFALPWGSWRVIATESSVDISSDQVLLDPAVQDGIPPVATLVAPVPPQPGPAGVHGPVLWLDADAATSLTATEGAVSEWRDRNTPSRFAAQADGTAQPTYVADQFNGRDVVRFDGASDFLAFDGSLLEASDYTVFVVHRRSSGTANRFYLGGTSTVPNENLHLGYLATDQVRHSQLGAANTYDSPVSSFLTGESQRIHTFVLDQNEGRFAYDNGSLIGSAVGVDDRAPLTAYPGAQIGRLLDGGDASYFHGDIAEVVIYDRALSGADRAAIEAYLEVKWLEAPPSFGGPSALPDLQLWLDASDAGTLRRNTTCGAGPSNGANPDVRCWQDKSGNDRNATQGGAGDSNPQRNGTGLNGHPTVRFDGVNDSLDYNGTFLADTNYTVAVVSRRTGDGSGTQYNFYLGGETNPGGNNRNLHLGYRGNTSVDHAQWGNDYGAAVTPFATGEPARQHTFRFDANVGKHLFQDGVEVAARLDGGGQTGLVSNNNARIGRFLDSYFQGDLAEIVIYDRALSPAEQTQLETYLADKWGIS